MPMDSEARALAVELSLPIDPPDVTHYWRRSRNSSWDRPCRRDPVRSWPLGVSCNGNISTRPICTAGRLGGASSA
jgi:hypothetical protein